jgi:hypothetical protein
MTDTSSLKFRIVARTDKDENDYSYVSDIQAGEIQLKKTLNMKYVFCRLELLELLGDQEVALPLETWYRPNHEQMAWSTQSPILNLTQNPILITRPTTELKFEDLERSVQILRNQNERLNSRVKYLEKELRKFTILVF